MFDFEYFRIICLVLVMCAYMFAFDCSPYVQFPNLIIESDISTHILYIVPPLYVYKTI